MAEQALGMGLTALNMGTQHYDKIRDPLDHRWKKMRGRLPREDPDIRDSRNFDDKGYVLKRRSEVGPNDEIVETVRHRGEVLDRAPGRPRMSRGSSSMDDVRSGRRDTGYDSESSVPPRERVRPRSVGGRSRRRGSSSSSSSSSSSELPSSEEERKRCRKMQRKKWITAAFASVATIHAASKVYSSIEAHDKRIIAVEQGEMTPTAARKKQKAARLQDAAAIGIAAIGIKGALSEWNEVQQEHGEHKELMRKQEEHHKKRLEQTRRAAARDQFGHGYYKARDGHWYNDGRDDLDSERARSRTTSRNLDGPRPGERKLLEGPDQGRARSSYGSDRGRGRDYSPNDRDYARDRSRRSSRRYDDY